MRSLMLSTAALGLALGASLGAVPALADATPREITVTGSATVDAAPDVATVTAGVETQAATAADALKQNSEAMTAVFAALKTAGIAEADTQTSQLTLTPVFQSDPGSSPAAPQVVAYQASNMVTVQVRDVTHLGGTIDTLTAAGANRLYGVSFDVDEPGAVLDTARQKAVADAQRKAALFAEAAGVRLGPVIAISEGGGGGAVPFRAKMDMAMAAPVAAGSVSLGADVTVVFGLAE
ncbi:MAG: SIMPL domain-containing protein [Amaricoccus sp.]|uniref:SIMPL domain-containing protein n=1 Tax=Amaricoccus sp. TaxID=1872485 RepID=UPI0039E58121